MGGANSTIGQNISLESVKSEVEKEYHKIEELHNDPTIATNPLVEDRYSNALLAHQAFLDHIKSMDDETQVKEIPVDEAGPEREWEQLAFAFSDAVDEYTQLSSMLNFNVGDIVQVKQDGIFVEGIVQCVVDNKVDVVIQDESLENEDLEIIENIDIHSNDIRKIHNWDHLEEGDTVRVKDGNMYVLAIVMEVFELTDEVKVSFNDMDYHNLDQELISDDDESGEQTTAVYPLRSVVKVETSRFATSRFRKAIKDVRLRLQVANAFRKNSVLHE